MIIGKQHSTKTFLFDYNLDKEHRLPMYEKCNAVKIMWWDYVQKCNTWSLVKMGRSLN